MPTESVSGNSYYLNPSQPQQNTTSSRPLNYTLSVPPTLPISSLSSAGDQLQKNISQVATSISDKTFFQKVVNFITDIHATPPYGYRHHMLTGIGQYLMEPAANAIARFKEPSGLQKFYGVLIAALSLPLTLLGASLKLIGLQFTEHVGELTSEIVPKTAPQKIDQIYDLLKIFDALCRKHGINYFVQGGTLLGAIRHDGIIPWDDDADVGIMDCDEEKVKNLQSELKEQGVIFASGKKGIDHFIQLRFDPKIIKEKYKAKESDAGNLDIFVYERTGDGKVQFSSPFFRAAFPRDFFFENEVTEIVDYPFGPNSKAFPVRGIRRGTDYLKRFFGSDCLEFGIQTHEHLNVCGFFLPLPVLRKTRYKIIKKDCAVGNTWK
jgi:lipopolysaccharide cholinephosphotransferase